MNQRQRIEPSKGLSFVKRCALSCALSVGVSMFSAQVSAEQTVYSPYGGSSTRAFLATALDTAALVIRPIVVFKRNIDNACSMVVLESDADGMLNTTTSIVMNGGNDTFFVVGNTEWSTYTCGSRTFWIKAFDPNYFSVYGYGEGGSDTMFTGPNGFVVVLGGTGVDQLTLERTRGSDGFAVGGPATDYFFPVTYDNDMWGQDGNDRFCVGQGWHVRSAHGDEGTDSICGTADHPYGIEVFNACSSCPTGPNRPSP